MNRRHFLTATAAALAAPRLARAQGARMLRFVPQADLSGMDPVITTRQVVRNAALLVWDTLYGVGADFVPKPQMCEGHDLSADGKVWTFTLRPGLRFHDNEPVLTRDVVASINRWMRGDVMGRKLQASLDAIEAVDDRVFRLRLKRPFPKLLYAFGKATTLVLAIMPERIARTDPSRSITDYVGSGPMVFRRDEWNAGARAAFERFAGYQPRQEPADWLAGGKRMLLDRIEWITMPDPSTAAAALQQGEIDWWEQPLSDLAPMLRRGRDIRVDVADLLGNVAITRMNHLYPPFNDVRVRRVIQAAVNQADYMGAVIGGDPALWKPMPSFFTPGTPLYTEAGSEPMLALRDIDAAKRMLAASGYAGETIILPAATDAPFVKAQAEISADLLTRLGMKIDFMAMDWGAHSTRTASRQPPQSGGWHFSHSWVAGAECANPAAHKSLDSAGESSTNGWAQSDAVQTAIAAWFDATDAGVERGAVDAANRAAMENVSFVPSGFFLSYTAWRRNVTGITKAPFPVFWGVGKS
ncbi:MAG TPA: ABC transporter substrate-binding protein [Roseomonas sp.]|jgi:peptide/nickel transport system substrate-binding protein